MSRTLGCFPRALAASFLFLLSIPLLSCSKRPAPERPRLVVLLVVDQFRADYLERFRDGFGENGFNRLLRRGAVFSSCFYPYGVTETAPGHATLATGTTPDRHGITGNNVVNEETGQIVAAVNDPASPVIGGTPESEPASPHRLLAATLGGEILRATDGEAKVFGVALKNRSANFATGREATSAYWYDELSGRFVTGRYFREALPAWVENFNRESGAARFYGRPWETEDQVFSPLTTPSGGPDAEFFAQVRRTPHGNELVLDFIRELMREEELGRDEVTDFLFVGFTANDLAGHDWGPYSAAVADITARTDRQVASLLALFDEAAGEGNWVLAFSSDHGVAPSVEQARERGLPGKVLNSSDARAAAERALTARWGAGPWLLPLGYPVHLVFDRAVMKRHGASVDDVARVAGLAAGEVEGVAGYFSNGSTNLPPELAGRLRLGHFPGRSPDVVLVPEPYAIRDPWVDLAQHGSPYDYDRHVPLIFLGAPFAPGEYDEPVTPADVAPTMAAAIGIKPPPEATGRVLKHALVGVVEQQGESSR